MEGEEEEGDSELRSSFYVGGNLGPIFDTHTLLGEGVRGPADDKAARLSARVYGEMREHKHGAADASEART